MGAGLGDDAAGPSSVELKAEAALMQRAQGAEGEQARLAVALNMLQSESDAAAGQPPTKVQGVDTDASFGLRNVAHQMLADETIRGAVESMASLDGAHESLADKVNLATRIPPTVFGALPSDVTQQRFYEVLMHCAMLCDFALPMASATRNTHVARLQLVVPPGRLANTQLSVRPITPVDVASLCTYIRRRLTPPPADPQKQMPEESKLRKEIAEGVTNVVRYVLAQDLPGALDEVTWEQLERWRVHDPTHAVAVHPPVVQSVFTLAMELLTAHLRLERYSDKQMGQRRPDRAVPEDYRPKAKLTMNTMNASDGPHALPTHMRHRKPVARPNEQLVSAVRITTASAMQHVAGTRMAAKRRAALGKPGMLMANGGAGALGGAGAAPPSGVLGELAPVSATRGRNATATGGVAAEPAE